MQQFVSNISLCIVPQTRREAVFLSKCSQEIYLPVLERIPRLLQIAQKALHQRSAVGTRIFQVMSNKIKIICMLRHI